VRIDVGEIVGDRARTLAAEAVHEMRERAELQMLVPRSIQIAVVKEELQSPQDVLAARRWVERGEIANDLVARHEAIPRNRVNDGNVAVGQAERRRGRRTRQPFKSRPKDVHTLVSIARHVSLTSAYPHRRRGTGRVPA
jgi:hypothetical protein